MRANRAKKKERHRLKRKERRRELRAARTGAAPLDLRESGSVTCYINRDWQVEGMASIYALKELRSGGWAFGGYLIDFYCCGLKDCWGHLDISPARVREVLRDTEGDVPSCRVDAGTARRLVAGAVRFTRQNRFRFPPRYERWLRLLGVSAHEPDADLTGFGVDGDPSNLLYVGDLAGLERRLIGETLEEAIERTGLRFVAPVDDPEDPFGDGSWKGHGMSEELDDQEGEIAGEILDVVRRWCFRNGVRPHAKLPDCVDLLVLAGLASVYFQGDDESESALWFESMLERAIELRGGRSPELDEAFEQFRDFVLDPRTCREFFRPFTSP